jgi:hypothetical protein
VLNYLSTVNSNIQDQFDDIYLAFLSYASLISENSFTSLNNYFVNVIMSGNLTTNQIFSPTIDTIKASVLAINKTSLGLSNVNNTSDINKPISNATQTALNLKLNSVDYTVVSKSSLGLSNVENTSDINKPISNATQTALNTNISNINTNISNLESSKLNITDIPTRNSLNINNIDNTSDLNKAISIDTQIALDEKVNVSDNANAITTINLNATNITTNTLTASKIIVPQSSGCWLIDAGATDLKINRMYPIICSLKNVGRVDDYFVVAPYYKLILYYNYDYVIVPGDRRWAGNTDTSSQTRTIDNTTGTSIIYISSETLYGTDNLCGSIRLFYHGNEIRLGNFSS